MTSDHLIGRTLDGRYRIESLVARGGMATVYAAADLRLRRHVAVKVMHASLAEDPDFVHRFEREAHAAAQLANPHVVAVHDQGRDADTGAVYLVMEYVVGRTVRDVLAARGPLTEVQALAVLDPVLQALAAAHDAGYVHRDVKPENVLIGDDGRVKVTDFGLARAIAASSRSAATQGVIIGTVAYLSPEQVEHGNADARSDVYGAGVLLYELLTGEVPHSGETPLAVAFQHVHADVPAPSLRRPGLSQQIDALVTTATRRDPGQRFRDAREFLAAVRSTRGAIDPGYAAPPMPEQNTVVIERPTTDATPTSTTPLLDRAATTAVAERPRRAGRRRRPPRALLVGALGVVLVGALGWWFTIGTHSTVPEVLGATAQDARVMLRSVDLGSQVSRTWSASVPEGSVIDAQPLPGTTVNRGTTVQLIVSKGPERYAVPSLAGVQSSAVKARLAEVKLLVGSVTYAYDNSAPSGTVLRSNPAKGAVARPGDTVDVVISKGPAPIAVPAVTLRTQASATTALESAGFTSTSATDYSDTVPSGSVIRSEPSAGTLLQRGARVKLVVSKGPAPVKVPDVFRLSQSRAESALRAAGLVVKVQKGSGRLLNLVKQQSPSAGTVVPRGSTVTITIV